MNPTEPKSNEPEFSDGCDHDGFQGGYERAGHSKENCPYVKHKSDTPETDAAEWKQLMEYENQRECGFPSFPADFDFARKLELERNQARRERDEAQRDLSLMRTQCRVGDVAFQHLHCTTHGQPIPDWVKDGLPNLYLTLAEIDQLRARVGELEKAIRNHVEASNNDDSAGDSFVVLVEIIKAIDDVMKGQE